MKATSFIVGLVTLAVSAAPPQAKPVKLDPAVMAKSVGDMTADEEQQFSDAVEGTMERVCVACHPFENIVKKRRSAPEWDKQVTLMAGRGAPGTPADFTAIKKYLARYYGVVNVNTATADELTSVLGLPAKAASAIVEYRQSHGDFADLASVEKV